LGVACCFPQSVAGFPETKTDDPQEVPREFRDEKGSGRDKPVGLRQDRRTMNRRRFLHTAALAASARMLSLRARAQDSAARLDR
jgi:hypothetical protein